MVGSVRKNHTTRYNVHRARNGGTWTDAQFTQKIVSHLRVLTREWIPSRKPMKDHSNSRTTATCEMCLLEKPKTYEGMFRGLPKRKTNFNADHELTAVPLVETNSISLEEYMKALSEGVDPSTLFHSDVNWGIRIERMFAESGWQLLCKDCHKEKTNIENSLRAEGKDRLASGEAIDMVMLSINSKCDVLLAELIKRVRNEKMPEGNKTKG